MAIYPLKEVGAISRVFYLKNEAAMNVHTQTEILQYTSLQGA